MLTRAQIDKAVTGRLKTEFPTTPVQSSDVSEGFARPSFFVRIETNRTEHFRNSVRREMTCRIVYFPSKRDIFEEEAYGVLDRLEKLFGLNLVVEDRTLTIEGASTEIVDKVVHYDFDLVFYDDMGSSGGGPGELMEELYYDG